jgi:3-hydroxyisobutyrate dehydrogenase-like beta-hydroxyacid dehydrogenase
MAAESASGGRDVGFLGLGLMGASMASRLVAAGHRVHVWNRSSAAVDRLVSLGAVRADTPESALATGIAFSMLANDAAADEVFSSRALKSAEGSVHVNMASISPALAADLAGRHADAGVAYAAAPVLGRPHVAAAGQLNILFAGPSDVRRSVDPFLRIMGARTWDFGTEPRTANTVKIAVNYNIIHALQALAESVSLVEAHGIDAQAFVDLLVGTLFDGVVYRGYGDAIVGRTYDPPAFTMALGFKDLGLAEGLAAEGGAELPTASILRGIFQEALDDESLRKLDWAAMAEVTRRRSRKPSPQP